MAFLRRGLLTNKGAVPSVHTRQSVSVNHYALPANDEREERDDHSQPVFHIRKVAKIVKMANTANEYHIVQLTCGHTAQSKSTFQGYCKKCKVEH
jgi:uncharacterized protein YbcV (DUF1398 family)